MPGAGAVVGEEQQVHGARGEPGELAPALEEGAQPVPLGVPAEHDPGQGHALRVRPPEVEDRRALVGVVVPRPDGGDREAAVVGEAVGPPGDAAPVSAAGLPACPVARRAPSFRDPGHGAGVIGVGVGDGDPEPPDVEGAEEGADALGVHREAVA